jgi:hypothetical protein
MSGDREWAVARACANVPSVCSYQCDDCQKLAAIWASGAFSQQMERVAGCGGAVELAGYAGGGNGTDHGAGSAEAMNAAT